MLQLFPEKCCCIGLCLARRFNGSIYTGFEDVGSELGIRGIHDAIDYSVGVFSVGDS